MTNARWLVGVTPLVVMLIVLVQELDPAPGYARFATFGSAFQTTDIGGLSLLGWLLLAVGAVIVIRRQVWLFSGLVLLSAVMAVVFVGRSLFDLGLRPSVILIAAQPALMLVSGFVAGRIVMATERSYRSAAKTLTFTIGLLALMAIADVTTGHASSLDETAYLVFKDSATSAIAASAIGGVLLAGRRSAHPWLVLLPGALILVTGFRRNVLLLLVGGILVYVVCRADFRALIRFVTRASLVLLVTALVAPPVFHATVNRADAVVEGLRGAQVDTGTEAHLGDVEVGWHAVALNPIVGYGRSVRLEGLAVEEGTPYIHNEYLQAWVFYGITGLVLMLLLFGTGMRFAVRTFRSRGAPPMQAAAAVFLAGAPFACMTAPFIQTTVRWPFLFGVAYAIVSCPARINEHFAAEPSKAEQSDIQVR